MANILLVDDHAPIRSALSQYLRLHGHTVTAVPNGRAALEHVTSDTDVVVTDLNMPGMPGTGLLHELRARAVLAPVIVMSGRFARPDEVAGAACVLLKPFSPDKLREAVDRALEKAPGRAIVRA